EQSPRAGLRGAGWRLGLRAALGGCRRPERGPAMAQSEQFVILPGAAALADFERKRLQTRLHEAGLHADAIAAHYVHVAEFAGPVGAQRKQQLRAVLGLTDDIGDVPAAGVVVVPRLGTVSPWSSKAGDIARNCGIEGLLRLERGVIYQLAPEPDVEALRAAGVLHDPMTETVLASPAAL